MGDVRVTKEAETQEGGRGRVRKRRTWSRSKMGLKKTERRAERQSY